MRVHLLASCSIMGWCCVCVRSVQRAIGVTLVPSNLRGYLSVAWRSMPQPLVVLPSCLNVSYEAGGEVELLYLVLVKRAIIEVELHVSRHTTNQPAAQHASSTQTDILWSSTYLLLAREPNTTHAKRSAAASLLRAKAFRCVTTSHGTRSDAVHPRTLARR